MNTITKKLSVWAREPVRVIHWGVGALVLVAAVAGDLSNALNGTETWLGAGAAIVTVVEGEVSRVQVTPNATANTSTTGSASTPSA